MRKRRYEILLPLKYNDGQAIPAELFDETREELVSRFGALSFSPNATRGIWIQAGVRFEDELFRFAIDVEESDENHAFFVNLKPVLLERFNQLEIYISHYPVELI
jgi:hypothetical protein